MNRSIRTWFRFAVLAFVLPLLGGPLPAAQPPTPKEYQIKAAFLFNFTQFVEWPPAAFADAATPFAIGVLGDDPFGSALDDITRGETVRNHPLLIKRSQSVEDLLDCQLIFISKSERTRLAEILPKLGARAILTVGETDGFTRRGGVINFYLEGNKTRFEINTTAAQRNGLKISSQLLNLGKIIESDPANKNM